MPAPFSSNWYPGGFWCACLQKGCSVPYLHEIFRVGFIFDYIRLLLSKCNMSTKKSTLIFLWPVFGGVFSCSHRDYSDVGSLCKQFEVQLLLFLVNLPFLEFPRLYSRFLMKFGNTSKILFGLAAFFLVVIFQLVMRSKCSSKTAPSYFMTGKEPSLALSFGHGRLGNQMSTFASLVAFEKVYKVRVFVTARQAEVLESYFDFQNLKNAPMRIIQTHFPDFNSYCWTNPFPYAITNKLLSLITSIPRFLDPESRDFC